MNRNNKGGLGCLILLLLLIISPVQPVSANTPPLPNIVIYVEDPPEDFSIVLVTSEESELPNIVKGRQGNYYAFNFWGLGIEDETGYTFQATANEEDTTLFIEGPLPSRTENYYILNIETQKLTEGPPTFPWLSAVLIGARLLLTLAIEALIFFILGYRQARSWIVFLIFNVITQGILFVWMNQFSPFFNYSYALIPGEFIVYAVETVGLPIFIREKKVFRTVLFAIVANTASLILGGLLLTLPVF
jgi:hypothetical protein